MDHARLELLELAHIHLKVVGCPMLRVPIWGDCPKHFDEPIPSHRGAPAAQMYPSAINAYLNSADSNIVASIRVDLSVGLESSESRPAV